MDLCPQINRPFQKHAVRRVHSPASSLLVVFTRRRASHRHRDGLLEEGQEAVSGADRRGRGDAERDGAADPHRARLRRRGEDAAPVPVDGGIRLPRRTQDRRTQDLLREPHLPELPSDLRRVFLLRDGEDH